MILVRIGLAALLVTAAAVALNEYTVRAVERAVQLPQAGRQRA